MSLVLVPSSVPAPRNGRPGRVSVVGLGPAGPDWLTPEAHAELAAADELIGYETLPRARARAARAAPPRDRQPRRGASARATRSSWRPAARAWRSCRRATRASSRWPPPCSRSSTAMSRWRTSRCGSCRASRRCRPPRPASARRWATTSASISLSDQLKPWEVVERRLDAAGAADLVLALYNPASRTRREQLARAVEVLRSHRADGDAGRRRARGRRAGGVGLGHDARRARPRRRRHAHAADRRVLDDAHDRAASRRASTRRVATRRERAPSPAAASTEASVGDVGPRRAAHDDHRQPALPRRVELGSRVRSAAVLGDDQVDRVVIDERQLPIERVRAAIEQDLAAGRKRRAGRVDAADQEPGVVDAREAGESLAAGRQQDALALAPDGRGGRVEIVDPVPAVAGALGPAGALEAQHRHAGGRRGPRRRCGDALGERVRGVDHGARRGARRASARAPRGRRSRRCGPRPSGSRGLATRPASDEVTATPARCRRRGELARLGRAAEDQDHAIARRV